jgi:hypothetical protein
MVNEYLRRVSDPNGYHSRYLGIEVDDALELAEETVIRLTTTTGPKILILGCCSARWKPCVLIAFTSRSDSVNPLELVYFPQWSMLPSGVKNNFRC